MNAGLQSPRQLVERSGYSQLHQQESKRSVLPALPLVSKHEPVGVGLDVIQFSSAIYIVNIDEGKLSADIMRIGKMEEEVHFNYTTSSSSAVAGVQFVQTSGTIKLAPKEDSAMIEVPILNSTRWSPTTEFLITLSDPEGCTLGLYLKQARVKVLDSSLFPLDDFRAQLEEGIEEGVEKINKFHLFGGFIYQMWQQDGMKWRTLVTIFLDQLHNIYVYIRLILAIYMVDVVFSPDKSKEKDLFIAGNKAATIYIVAALIVGPMFILYAADLIKIAMDIPGRLQRDLSRNLFRKFMNYNKQSREEIPCPDMVTSLTQDATTCSGGYMNVLRMFRVMGKLVISIYFTLSQNPSAWWACVLVPGLMGFWAARRTNAYINASEVKGAQESASVAFVNEALNKMGLIADYQQRPQMNELFAVKSEELRGAQIPESLVVKNNMFFPELLGPALIALYTAVGGSLVLAGELRIGVYLATISVFGDICDSFSSLFHNFMEIISTFAPLKGLTIILNKATDVPALKQVNRSRRSMTKDFRAELIKAQKERPPSSDEPFCPASDKMDIKLVDMEFGHPGHELIFQKTIYSSPQGSITAIIGQSGKGRRTLMELVAHKMFPSAGNLFVPSHLRILYVSSDSVLLNLSLWQNLTFGNSKGNNPFRIEKILQELKMYECLELIHPDLTSRKKELGHGGEEGDEDEEGSPQQAKGMNPLDKMRSSQKADIHLARALIMNPEVMVCHRPFANYPKAGDDESCEKVRGVFLEHVRNRGFQMDPAGKMNRRPRTLFFTPDTADEAQMADMCWVLPNDIGGKCVVDKPSSVWPSAAPAKSASEQAHTFERRSSVREPESENDSPNQYSGETGSSSKRSASPIITNLQQDRSASPTPMPTIKPPTARNSLQSGRDAALQQELLALGPRPMGAIGLAQMLDLMRDAAILPPQNAPNMTASTRQKWAQSAQHGAEFRTGNPGPLVGPDYSSIQPGAMQQSYAQMEAKRREADNKEDARRCCGP